MTERGQRTAAVIGLGLMGGSLARDLAEHGWRIAAADRDQAALEAAIAAGTVDHAFEAGCRTPDMAAGAGIPATTEIVVVATPVRAVPGLLRWLARAAPAAAAITDVASTKRTVMDAARTAGIADRFIGGHPMAGDHRSGWGAARNGLFAGAPVWLCHDGASAAALDRVTGLWATVGSRPRVIDAEDHDRLVAWSSHLPQLTASALGTVLARAGVHASELGPGGRDVTRLAGSDPALWCQILTDNADLLAPALDALADELARFCRCLRARDDIHLSAMLEEARSWVTASGVTS